MATVRRSLVLVVAALACVGSFGSARAADPVATFSIVGYDPQTKELGVAVQSRFFAVGSVVPWARAGVGAIATQAFANTTFGPRGLGLLEAGRTPEETMKALLADDEGRDRRQVGIVDAQGRSASHTGKECQPWAGGVTGPNFSAQGNILVSQATVQAMAKTFQETKGILGEKLMRAIEAGQAAGGDSRGMQSAAILIVREKRGYGGFNDRYCDLRVDDAKDPIRELRRIFDMWQLQALINDGYLRVEAGDFAAAIQLGETAVKLDPTSAEAKYDLACFLSRAGRKAEAIAQLELAVKLDPAMGPRGATDTDLAPLKDDPKFQALTAKPKP
jgi:uncharacterized Ntn-hydrolase superfamily protein